MGFCCFCCSSPKVAMFNRFFAVLLTIIALVLSVVAITSCHFVAVVGERDLQFGLFQFKAVGSTCISYDQPVDQLHSVAQVGIITTTIALCIALGLQITLFILQNLATNGIWNVTRFMYLAAFLGAVATSCFYGSVHDICFDADEGLREVLQCNIGLGGHSAGGSMLVLSFVLILMGCITPPAQQRELCRDFDDDMDEHGNVVMDKELRGSVNVTDNSSDDIDPTCDMTNTPQNNDSRTATVQKSRAEESADERAAREAEEYSRYERAIMHEDISDAIDELEEQITEFNGYTTASFGA